METRIRIGIGGWTYPPWRGLFFPPGLPQREELGFASRQFGAIEINATFYRRQSPKSWSSWAAAVPEDFSFAIKGSRYCVTRPRLAEAREALDHFFDQGMSALGAKLGPVVWTLASHRAFDREDVAAFLDLLPGRLDGLALRHAIEPRHESFRDPAFIDLCREHDVAIVLGDSDDFPCIDADTASFTYARLQRMREEIETGYDEPALDGFAERARRWSGEGREPWIFMINGAKSRAPAAALALQHKLGIGGG